MARADPESQPTSEPDRLEAATHQVIAACGDATDYPVRKSRRPETVIRPDSPGKFRQMCREWGFKVKTDADDGGVCDVTLVLDNG